MADRMFNAFGAPTTSETPNSQGIPRRYSDVAVSRVPGILPARRGLDEYANWSRQKGRLPTERTGGLDIFIGGGADDLKPPFPTGVMRDYADRYGAETGRPTAYFGNGKKRDVMAAIRDANRTDGPINITGHSWGGTDAYNVAAQARRAGLRVDNVNTLDPVGGGLGLAGRDTGRPSAHWTNVTASPRTPGQADWIAAIGGKPSELPISEAQRMESIRTGHEDVDAMMRMGPRDVLDQSRRLPQPRAQGPVAQSPGRNPPDLKRR